MFCLFTSLEDYSVSLGSQPTSSKKMMPLTRDYFQAIRSLDRSNAQESHYPNDYVRHL